MDAVLQHELKLAASKLNLTAAFNYNHSKLDSVRTGVNGEALFNAMTLYNLMHETPNTKLVLSADWHVDQWDLTSRATRYGSLSVMSYDPASPPFEFTPSWVLDLEAKYALSTSTSIVVGSGNLTNRYPTRTTNPADSYSGAFPYNFVSPVGMNGAYYYARLNYNF
jgi:iron complex outermembrane receptor protein